MIILTEQKSGSETIGIINANLAELGYAETVPNSDATTVCNALNNIFGERDGAVPLMPSMSSRAFIEAVNANFEMAAQVRLVFLHFSDPHGTSSASTKSRLLANRTDSDIDFVFITGDVPTYGKYIAQTSGTLRSDLTAIGNKLLLCVGNHDVYDYQNANGQQSATNFLKGVLGNRVTWGDQTGVASYWHKDIPLNSTAKLRIISLDQYELGNVRYPGVYTYFTEYSQGQIYWLISRLKELSPNDYFFIAMHEAPVLSPTKPDTYATGLIDTTDPRKLFVSENLEEFGNRIQDGVAREPQLSLLPRILKAYMHKESLSMTFNNYGGNLSSPDITINESFDGEPATFLFWLCGHMHCDIVDYIPDESDLEFNGERGDDWSDQLLVDIVAADRSVSYQGESDLVADESNEDTYRINKVTLDFANKTIRIDRIGDNMTESGRVRDSITFPFKKGGV